MLYPDRQKAQRIDSFGLQQKLCSGMRGCAVVLLQQSGFKSSQLFCIPIHCDAEYSAGL